MKRIAYWSKASVPEVRVVTMHAGDRYLRGGTMEDLRKLDCHPMLGYASILQHGVNFRGWISIEDGPDPATGLNDICESAIFCVER
jgi:hypothetical protein